LTVEFRFLIFLKKIIVIKTFPVNYLLRSRFIETNQDLSRLIKIYQD
jgi:hypothetical protein